MRIYIKNKNNFENFLILIFAIIFIIFSIVILIKNTFGIKFDRPEGKDKSGKKRKNKEISKYANRTGMDLAGICLSDIRGTFDQS